jgi:hypothetical protein
MQIKIIRFKCLNLILLFTSCSGRIESNKTDFSKDVMKTLSLAIKSYEIDRGKLPIKLSDMVPVHCQPGRNGFNDGWGRVLHYDNFSGDVICCGSDGILHTKDDLYIKQDGTNNF